jgi:gamma-glutamylcyclotransferase (GGCT)/AIG2-like uncharacterized protein YtfP
MNHLFAYGTLMCADIMEDVAGSSLASMPATLNGFIRRAVRGEHYPGVIPDPAGRVEGVVYRGVPRTAWKRLDRFEGSMYARRTVPVELVDGAELFADVYVVRPEFVGRLDRSGWNFEDFVRSRKSSFQKNYQGFRSL